MKISTSLQLIVFLFTFLQTTNSESLHNALGDNKRVDNNNNKKYAEIVLNEPNSINEDYEEKYMNILNDDLGSSQIKTFNRLLDKIEEKSQFNLMKRSSRVVKKIKPIVYNGYSMDINIEMFKSTVSF